MSSSDDVVLSSGLAIERSRLPRHVAIIMDGNGRWAESRGLPRIEGHRQGVGSVRRITEECCRLGIEQLTLYCLSVENWKRPRQEVDLLMELLARFLVDERPTIMNNNVRLRVIGRREGLPAKVLELIDETVALSESNTGMTLCLAINYGGRTEIVDVIRAMAGDVAAGRLKPAEISETTVAEYLQTRDMPDPDLLIRTAGERRVSNFLLWQISYSEIWITAEYWPDFDIDQLHQSLGDFARRERRFGGLTAC